jgi:serine/threonine protein kinase
MTMFIKSQPHCVEYSSSNSVMDRNCGYRWPDRFAKLISDNVHRQVQQMLGESRLTRNNDNDIQLIQPGEIFSVDRVLGSGAFSQVSAVTTKDGRRYACKHLQQKLMEKPEDFQLAAAELAFEAHILSSFDHPNILKIRGWAANGIASFESGKHDSFFLLLDLLTETLDQRIIRWRDDELNLLQNESKCTGSLPNLIMDENVANQNFNHQNHSQQNDVADKNLRHETLYLEKIRIMSEIASALDYIHAQGVVFRDLKPQNIGFSAETNSVQIFDFGLSRELPSLDTSAPFSMSGKVGTLRYMAPEVATNQAYNISSDVYSWAIVSYELLSLEKPFDGWTRDLHADFVCTRGLRPETTNTLHPISSDMKMILEQAWNPIPSNRGTMSQIGVQLQCLMSNQMAYITEQQKLQVDFQERRQRQILEQQQMSFAVGSASAVSSRNISNSFYIDNISLCMLNNSCPPTTIPPAATKISRNLSFESIETINTSPHSVDSFNYF